MTEKSNPERPTYFCWIRVVDVGSATTPAPVTPFPLPPDDDALRFLHWNRPNARIKADSLPKGDEPTGVWSVTDGFFGREEANTAFDFGPAFLSECDATHWLAHEVAGQRWDKESLNRFLLQFTLYKGS
jgi:hypothetical protein